MSTPRVRAVLVGVFSLLLLVPLAASAAQSATPASSKSTPAAGSKSTPVSGSEAAPAAGKTVGQPWLFQAESGTIQYKLSGMLEGSSTLAFDQKGQRSATLVKATVKMEGMEMATSTHLITTGKEAILVNNADRSFMRLPPDAAAQQGMEQPDPALMVKKLGTSTVLGRTCELMTDAEGSVKMCLWQGIPLRTEVGAEEGRFVQEAVALDLGKVDAKLLTVPQGYKENKAPDLTKMMEGAMDPEAMQGLMKMFGGE